MEKSHLNLFELVNVCVRCGTCLTSCPVYEIQRDEAVSPRGKIYLIKYGLEGKIKEKGILDVLPYCSLCGGCEFVCPSGIRTIDIIIEARKKWGKNRLKKIAIDGLTKEIFPAHLFTTILSIISPEKFPFSPSPRPFLSTVNEFIKGKGKGKVLFFVGCLTNKFFPNIARAISEIVVKAGYDLYIPKGQVCCGFPYLSIGEEREFQKMKTHNLKMIKKIEPDLIISPCPTGLNTFRRYYRLDNVIDVSNFVLKNLEHLKLKNLNWNMTWHDPCHLKKELGIRKEPRKVLSIVGNFVEMERPDLCCGFGGSFSLSHPEISFKIRNKKKEFVLESGADYLVTECPGCIMFLGSYSPVKTLHLGEIVNRAIR